MRITDLLENETETVRDAPPAGETGDLVTSAQAASIMGCTMANIRMLVKAGTLKSLGPETGRRDHLFKRKDVEALAKQDRKPTGRPKGS